MKIANPNQYMPFGEVVSDASGNPEYGTRTVDGIEEIVNLKTGKSNMDYFTPEQTTFYENCAHKFNVVNMGWREVECTFCHLMTAFHPAANYKEENGKAFIILKGREYEIV